MWHFLPVAGGFLGENFARKSEAARALGVLALQFQILLRETAAFAVVGATAHEQHGDKTEKDDDREEMFHG